MAFADAYTSGFNVGQAQRPLPNPLVQGLAGLAGGIGGGLGSAFGQKARQGLKQLLFREEFEREEKSRKLQEKLQEMQLESFKAKAAMEKIEQETKKAQLTALLRQQQIGQQSVNIPGVRIQEPGFPGQSMPLPIPGASGVRAPLPGMAPQERLPRIEELERLKEILKERGVAERAAVKEKGIEGRRTQNLQAKVSAQAAKETAASQVAIQKEVEKNRAAARTLNKQRRDVLIKQRTQVLKDLASEKIISGEAIRQIQGQIEPELKAIFTKFPELEEGVDETITNKLFPGRPKKVKASRLSREDFLP